MVTEGRGKLGDKKQGVSLCKRDCENCATVQEPVGGSNVISYTGRVQSRGNTGIEKTDTLCWFVKSRSHL